MEKFKVGEPLEKVGLVYFDLIISVQNLLSFRSFCPLRMLS